MRIRFGLSLENYDILCCHLSPFVMELNSSLVDGAGWEETADAALTYFLRTTLSRQAISVEKSASKLHNTMKTSTEKQTVFLPSFPVSTDKLKRHVAMLCERLEQGVWP